VFLEVFENGKSWKTVTHYPASKRIPAESVERKHRNYSAVESRIVKGQYEEIK